MPSSTPRLGLTLPLQTELIDPSPPTGPPAITQNFTLLDGDIGAFICTSTTHPSSPYDLQLIYETDTGLLRLWDATLTSWITLTQLDSPGKIIFTNLADVVTTSPAIVDGSRTLVYATPNIGLVSGRNYLIEAAWSIQYLANYASLVLGDTNIQADLVYSTSGAITTGNPGTILATSTVTSVVKGGASLVPIPSSPAYLAGELPYSAALYLGIWITATGGTLGTTQYTSGSNIAGWMSNYLNVYGG